MNLQQMASLGWKHTVSAAGEELYLKTGIDLTRPVAFYGLVNERCNVKCRYCEYWRLKEYSEEMTLADWQRALLSIKEFVGTFSISFSGGEPFLKAGFIDLMVWCHDNGISSGVTTNGSALTPRNAAKLVSAHPFNVNISVDAPTAEVHDYLRGSAGLFQRLGDGIGFLAKERDRQRVSFPIIIKPTVNAANFRYLPELVEWTERVGATCISLQPVDRWTPETYGDLWIEENDLPELETVIERLVSMAAAGAPILTPPHVMRLMPDHFRGKAAPADLLPCRVGMRNFFIRSTGSVELCSQGFPAVGNVKTDSARDIWYGATAKEVRRDTLQCERLCLVTCVSQKGLRDKVAMGLRLLAPRKMQR